MLLFLADAVVVLHVAFIAFVVLGGLLVLRRPRLGWAHAPIAAYGMLIEYVGWTCPLTPLENALRRAAGDAGYEGGFIEHYVLPLVYPPGLTPRVTLVLGSIVLVVNGAVYGRLLQRARARRRAGRSATP